MALADRLLDVDRHDLDDYTPWYIGEARFGSVRRDLLGVLAEHPRVFDVAEGRVRLRPEHDDYASRTAAVHEVVRDLHGRGLLMGWWDELHPVVREWNDEPVMEIERGGLDPFGVHSFGVHLNGYVRSPPGGISLWVARRSREKGSYPGELDHLAAGGQPLGLSLRENMIKECAEEAGIPRALAERMTAHGSIRYRSAQPHGLNDDRIFCFDLELPAAFEPENQDGEVESFELWPVERVIECLQTTRDFKFNVGPVILDFLERHDLLPHDETEVRALLGRMRG